MEWGWGLPKDWKPKLAVLALVGLYAGGGWLIRSLPDEREAALLRTDTAAPEFTLPDTDGTVRSLAGFRGRAVVVNFMTTWCGPCLAELPLLRDAARRYAGSPIAFVGVNVNEQAPRVARLVREQDLPYPVLVDADGAVAALYRVQAYPTTYFVDHQGIIRAAEVGSYASEFRGAGYFQYLVESHLGSALNAIRKAEAHCPAAPADEADPLPATAELEWAWRGVACACGCQSKLMDCDCGAPRGGREMRRYFAGLCEDPDFSAQQASSILRWKYRADHVRP